MPHSTGRVPGRYQFSAGVSIVILLAATAVLMVGNGLLTTVIGVRAAREGFSSSVIGVVMSGYFAGYIIGAWACVKAIEDVGHIRAFSAFAAVISAVAIAHAVVLHPVAWFLFRLVAGFCIVGLFMVIESWLNAEAPQGRRGRVMAVYMMVTLSSIGLGQLLLTMADLGTFVLFAVASMLYALSIVPTALTRVQAPVPQQAGGVALRRLFAVSGLGVSACFAVGLVSGAFWALGPVFATGLDLPGRWVAFFMAAAIAGGTLAQLPVGRYSDRHDRTAVMLAAGVMLVASALGIATVQARWPVLLLAAAFLFGASFFPLYALAVAHTHDRAGPGRAVDVTRGLMLVYGVGAVLGPLAGGALMQLAGPGALFAFMAGVGVVLCLGTWWWRGREGIAVEAQSAYVPMIRTSQEALEMAEEAVQEAAPDGKSPSS